jgi:dTDP-4-dehydrorhamnose 3,5-epimerase
MCLPASPTVLRWAVNRATVLYKCTDFYHPEDKHGVIWSDSDLGIPWPVVDPLLSDKDQKLPRLRDLTPEQLPVYT